MKIIYASAMRFPSGLASNIQILSMSKAFGNKLGRDFYLGLSKMNPGKESCLELIPNLEQDRIIAFGQIKSYFLAWKYLRFIKKHQIDYVFCRAPRLLFFLILYSRIFYRGLKFIYEVHLIPEKTFLDRLIEKTISRAVHCFIFITNHLQELYIKKYPCPRARTIVLSDAVDLDIFDLDLSKEQSRKNLGLRQDKKIIGFFGRFRTMRMEKGLDTILKSLEFLPSNIMLLAMGGKPRAIKDYSERAQKLGLKERVVFVESLSQHDVAIRQKACDILLMPFPYNQHYAYYMSPLKMFEYMASNRPIIASDLPSIKEILNENNAFFVRPDDPKNLARVIQQVLSDPKNSDRAAVQAYKDVNENYTWQKRVEKILAFMPV